MAAAFMVLATLVLAAVATAQEYNPARKRPAGAEQPVAERLIVKFRPSSRVSTQATTARESAVVTNAARLNAFASRARLTLEGSREIGENLHAVQVQPQSSEGVVEVLARVRADSEVEYAVMDRKVYPHATSNDPGAPGQWYLGSGQLSAINAQGAWDITKGHDGVVIAVIDTGVRFDHPDLQASGLAGKVLPGYDFVSGDPGGAFRTANDGNGRDPDASDPGDWVAAADGCGDIGDSSWHGTRVSGIIGAMTNNSTGVAGASWYGYILPVRALGKCGGYNSDVLAGMRWAAGLNVPGVPQNPNPAKVINVSLGSVGGCDAASANTIRDVTDAGVLVVVSAGNEGGPVDSPANCPGAMAILGLRQAGTKVGFSSLGPQIALGAPGGNCVNIGAGEACLFSIDTTSNAGTTTPGANIYTNQIDFNVGTSFSSPIVSGIAGLMLAVNGNLRSEDLIQRMQNAAKAFPTRSDTTTTQCTMPGAVLQNQECICNTTVCGAGMANALGSVQEAQRPIAAILAPASVSQGQPFTLDASGSAAACGRTITGYSWTVVSGGSGTVTPSPLTGPTTSLTPPTTGSATVRVTVTDNTGQMDTANVVITASAASVLAPARANAGTTACLTALTPSVIVTATDAGAGEPDNTGTFTVTRGGDPSAALNVSLSISGSATSGSDFQAIATTVAIPAGAQSGTVTVTPIDDTALEGGETVIATVQAGTGYAVGAAPAATVNLADDDTPQITIVATDPNATEGGDAGVFTLTRTGGSTPTAVTVGYALSGTATAGTDYATLGGTVSIPAGQTTATIALTPTDDTSSESSETATVTLQTGAGYEVSTPSTATITIADNDSAAPPPNNNGGGGGGGVLDLLTLLLGAMTFVARAAMRQALGRHVTVQSR